MSDLYQKIHGDKYRNIWAVGDLHGCHALLMNRLSEVRFSPEEDLLISVGDLIDRGNENVECLELITMPWFRAVRGNHEQMMIDALLESGDVNHWLMNGGGWFFHLDYDKERLARALSYKVAELPLVIELTTAGKTIVICHADYPHDHYEFSKSISRNQVLWSRERICSSQDGLANEIKGADMFIFGHTPTSRPITYCNQTYIDTGAVFNGNLTLLQLQG